MLTHFKSSSREFHSLIDDKMENFCEILVRLEGTEIVLLFLMGNLKFHLLEEELNIVHMKAPCQY